MTTVITAMVLVAAALLLLGVRALFVRGGRFPSGHVSDIPALRSKGIGCTRKLK